MFCTKLQTLEFLTKVKKCSINQRKHIYRVKMCTDYTKTDFFNNNFNSTYVQYVKTELVTIGADVTRCTVL